MLPSGEEWPFLLGGLGDVRKILLVIVLKIVESKPTQKSYRKDVGMSRPVLRLLAAILFLIVGIYWLTGNHIFTGILFLAASVFSFISFAIVGRKN